jgi:hypothetical protein
VSEEQSSMWPEAKARAEALILVANNTRRMGVGRPLAGQEAELGMMPDDLVRMANYIVTGRHEALGDIVTVELGTRDGEMRLRTGEAYSQGHLGVIIDPEGVADWLDSTNRELEKLKQHNQQLFDQLAAAREKEQAENPPQRVNRSMLYWGPLGSNPDDRMAWLPLGYTDEGISIQGTVADSGVVHFDVAASPEFSKSPMEKVFQGNAEQFQAWLDAGSPRPEEAAVWVDEPGDKPYASPSSPPTANMDDTTQVMPVQPGNIHLAGVAPQLRSPQTPAEWEDAAR